MSDFQSFWVEKNDEGVTHSIIDRDVKDLPAGEVLIEVHYSSVNYKDALSANGMPGVTRSYPHAPGIDALELRPAHLFDGLALVALAVDRHAPIGQ